MAPHRWVLEVAQPDADGEGQNPKHADERGPNEPERQDAEDTEDTEGLGFRFPNAGNRPRRSSARRSRLA